MLALSPRMNEQDLCMCPSGADQASPLGAANERPLKICAEVLIRHVASDYQRDTQSFRFDELDPPGPSIAAARSACDTDILVLAVGEDRILPSHVKLWLGLCVALRDEDQDGALVVLISNGVETTNLDSPLLEYLEAVAAIGGLTFFPRTLAPRFAAGSGLPTTQTRIRKTLNRTY